MEKIFVLSVVMLSGAMLFYGFKNRRSNFVADEKRQPVLITGHRGAAGLAQENTLLAIEAGINLQCDRLEIDIHQTSDSVLVVMHDETIDRMTNGKGRIKNMSYSQLQQFRIKPFNKDDTVQQIIPTLEQVIRLVDGRAVLLIELKHGNDVYAGIEDRVMALIRQYNAQAWCIIQSFKMQTLERFHSIAPEMQLHELMLTGMFRDSIKDFITEVSVYDRMLTKKFIDRMHEQGKRVNVWTVNNSREMEYFIHLGVDGVITDFPDIARQVVMKKAFE